MIAAKAPRPFRISRVIAVVVLRAYSIRLGDLAPLVPELLRVLPTAPVRPRSWAPNEH